MFFKVLSLLLLLAGSLGSSANLCGAVLVQQQAGVFAFEAEHYDSLTPSSGASTWSLITTTSGIKPLPSNTNAKGTGAMILPQSSSSSFITYRLQFTHDGVYNLYTRYAVFDMNADGGYGNEDSIFIPDAFDQSASTSGIWHEQFLSTTYNKEGVNFTWDLGNGMTGPSDARVSTGLPQTYTITGASVENPVEVTFTVRGRENGTALDQFIFTTSTYALVNDTNATLNAIQSVPEPTKALLCLVGFGSVFLCRRKRVA